MIFKSLKNVFLNFKLSLDVFEKSSDLIEQSYLIHEKVNFTSPSASLNERTLVGKARTLANKEFF